MTQAEVLARAADLVEQGWCQGDLHTAEGYCAVGAIGAAYGHLTFDCAAYLALRMEVGGSVMLWNDAKGRTKEEVVTALRNAKRFLPEGT